MKPDHSFQPQPATQQQHRNYALQIKQWALEVFNLSEDSVVMVQELKCADEGCPDVMTLIAFWLPPTDLRQEYRIFKPFRQIQAIDVREAKNSMLNNLINRELKQAHEKKKK
jgi:hypothetical protein